MHWYIDADYFVLRFKIAILAFRLYKQKKEHHI